MWLFAGDEYLRFLGGRALETLVKQLAEMSLFVKHVAVVSDATYHAISVKAFGWRTR